MGEGPRALTPSPSPALGEGSQEGEPREPAKCLISIRNDLELHRGDLKARALMKQSHLFATTDHQRGARMEAIAR